MYTLGAADDQYSLSLRILIQQAVHCLEITERSHQQAFHSQSDRDVSLSSNKRDGAFPDVSEDGRSTDAAGGEPQILL
jgi:hypothetical protein